MPSLVSNRLLLLGGILGPAVFATTVASVGAMLDQYDHVNQFISELGATGADHAWVMNYFGFMLSAALMLIFALAARRHFPRSALNLAGTLLVATFATGVFLAGVFSCDQGCSPVDPTLDQRIHDLVSVIAFLAFASGAAVWGAMFLRMPGWRGFGFYSFASTAASLVVLVAMIQSESARDGTGLYQRLFLATLMIWLAAIAVRLLRRTASEAPG